MDVTKFSFCILLFAIGLFKNSVHGEVNDVPVTEEIPTTISSELIPVPEIAQIQLDKYCRSYKCLQQITNLTEIDKQCRVMSNSNRDRLCYCCGGSKSYHTFGEVCRRYCRQEKNEAGEFFEPCKPSQNTSDENNDNKFNPDKPFPVIPILVQENELDCDFSSVANVTSQSKDSKENIDSPTTNLRPRPDSTKPQETNGQQNNATQTEGDKDQQSIGNGQNHEILNVSSQGSKNNLTSNEDENSRQRNPSVGQESSNTQGSTFSNPNGDDTKSNLKNQQLTTANSEIHQESVNTPLPQGSNSQVGQQISQGRVPSQYLNPNFDNVFNQKNQQTNSNQGSILEVGLELNQNFPNERVAPPLNQGDNVLPLSNNENNFPSSGNQGFYSNLNNGQSNNQPSNNNIGGENDESLVGPRQNPTTGSTQRQDGGGQSQSQTFEGQPQQPQRSNIQPVFNHNLPPNVVQTIQKGEQQLPPYSFSAK